MMNRQLMKKRYRAPSNHAKLPLANPNPAVQRGGIRAVAIATPEKTVPFSGGGLFFALVLQAFVAEKIFFAGVDGLRKRQLFPFVFHLGFSAANGISVCCFRRFCGLRRGGGAVV